MCRSFNPAYSLSFASISDAREVHGAVGWLLYAYQDYRNRVINRQISYKVFTEENIVRLTMPIILDENTSYEDILQERIDRDKVAHILQERKFTEDYFTADKFQEADALRMIAGYNALDITPSERNSQSRTPRLLQYSSSLQDALAEIFRKHNLLTPTLSTEDFLLFFSTGKPSQIYSIPASSRNVHLGLAIAFLVEAGAVTRDWAGIMCRHEMLLSSEGKPIRAGNIGISRRLFSPIDLHSLTDKQKEIAKDFIALLGDKVRVKGKDKKY